MWWVDGPKGVHQRSRVEQPRRLEAAYRPVLRRWLATLDWTESTSAICNQR